MTGVQTCALPISGPEPPDIFAPATSTTETNEQRIARSEAEADKQEAEREARRANARNVAKANFDSALAQVDDYNGDIDAAFDSYRQNVYDTLNEQGEADRYAYDVADREFDRLVEEHRAKQTPVPSVTKTKVTPITQDANVMSAAPEYHTEVTVPALQAIQAGNFVPVTLKDGRQAKLVVGNNQEDTEGRVTAYDENNNEIGHVQYTKVEDEQGNRFNPHTVEIGRAHV